MKNFTYTIESFGPLCPSNWREICDWLNSYFAPTLETCECESEARELYELVWMNWCDGLIAEAPEPIFN